MPHPFAEGLEVSHVASVPGGHRWVKHFDTTLLTRHLRIVCSCRLEANISSWYFHTSKVAIAGVWQTNPGWIIRLPILQCRSGSSNVLARPTGPVTRAQKSELRVVRVWNEMSRITRLSITATKYTVQHASRILRRLDSKERQSVVSGLMHLSWKIASFSSEPSGGQRPRLVVAVFEDGLSRRDEARRARHWPRRWFVGSPNLQTMAAAHLTGLPLV